MQVFEKDYELTYSHIDWRGVSRPSAVFDFMQDAATQHARFCHLDRDDIGAIWVLSRMRLELDRPLRPYERLHLATFCAGIKGASWLRAFDFSVDGAPVGRAISSWVVLETGSHRILRPSSVPGAADYACSDRPTLPMPGKLSLPALTHSHDHPVRYSDLDVNRHLNNVRIAALVSDALDPGANEFVNTLQINYTAETPPGAVLSLSAAREGAGFAVRGEAEGRVRFEAAGTLAPL